MFYFSSRIILDPAVVFYATPTVAAFVNIKPILPGHVLVIPKAIKPRFSELLPEEVSELFLTVQKVGKMLNSYYSGKNLPGNNGIERNSLTITIQDGVDAGQTIPVTIGQNHVHVHVIPRSRSDFKDNDEIYHQVENNYIPERPLEEMKTEAEIYRLLLNR